MAGPTPLNQLLKCINTGVHIGEKMKQSSGNVMRKSNEYQVLKNPEAGPLNNFRKES